MVLIMQNAVNLRQLLIVVALAVTVVIGVSAVMMMDYVEQTYYSDVREAANVLADEVTGKGDLSYSYARLIAYNEPFAEAVAGKNPSAIWQVGTQLTKGYDIDYITITDENGIVLARLHEDPNTYGDSLATLENVRSALDGRPMTSVGSSANIPVRVATGYPLYYDNRLVGAITLGYRFDTEAFVDSVKLKTGGEISVCLGDTRFMTTIISGDGNRAIGTKVPPAVAEAIYGGASYYTTMTGVVGKIAVAEYIPLKDSSGEIIGMFCVGKFISGASRIVIKTILISAAAAVIVSAATIFWFTSKKLGEWREARHDQKD